MRRRGSEYRSTVPRRVVACVVRRDGKLLLCLRPRHKRHGSLWEFPGGKLKRGERFLSAARRELREELGVTVTAVGEPLFEHADPGSDFTIHFVEAEIDRAPVLNEHIRAAWVPISHVLALPLAPADHVFAQVGLLSRHDGASGDPEHVPLREILASFLELWGLSSLTDEVTIEIGWRLRRSLGNCYTDRRLIRINPALLHPSRRELLKEVVCHEAAHIAVQESFGSKARPHGPEWKRFVTRAGYLPETQLAFHRRTGTKKSRKRVVYEHRCPVCQTVRMAEAPVANWRCASCRAVGLDGRLTITSFPATRPRLRRAGRSLRPVKPIHEGGETRVGAQGVRRGIQPNQA